MYDLILMNLAFCKSLDGKVGPVLCVGKQTHIQNYVNASKIKSLPPPRLKRSHFKLFKLRARLFTPRAMVAAVDSLSIQWGHNS